MIDAVYLKVADILLSKIRYSIIKPVQDGLQEEKLIISTKMATYRAFAFERLEVHVDGFSRF